jgi:predicted methyltransferase
VAAAVNVLADDRKERVKALANAGVDAIVFDNRRDSLSKQLESVACSLFECLLPFGNQTWLENPLSMGIKKWDIHL